MTKNDIQSITLSEDRITVTTMDGRTAYERFADYPRLRHATPDELAAYTVDDTGIHWASLDEDLCFDGFFNKPRRNQLYELFTSHPELNASAIARRLGISQSLFAQYVSGTKRPSAARIEEIISTVRAIGRELQAV